MDISEFTIFFANSLEISKDINYRDSLSDIKEYDSTGVLMLCCAIEDTFHQEIDFLQLKRCTTVEDIYKIINAGNSND